MSLEDEVKQAAICKLHLDLWMHQNTLMWSRVQTLSFVQAGFLALANSLATNEKLKGYATWACLICTLVTFGLGIVMWTDRHLRNIHRASVESFDLKLHPASTAQTSLSTDYGAKFIEPAFHVLIFVMFMFLDLLAARVLGLAVPWVVGLLLMLFLAYGISVAYFYQLARKH